MFHFLREIFDDSNYTKWDYLYMTVFAAAVFGLLVKFG